MAAYYARDRESAGSGMGVGGALLSILLMGLAMVIVFNVIGGKLGISGEGLRGVVAGLLAPPKFQQIADEREASQPLVVRRPRVIPDQAPPVIDVAGVQARGPAQPTATAETETAADEP